MLSWCPVCLVHILEKLSLNSLCEAQQCIYHGTLDKSLNNQVYTHCVMHNKVYITAHWTRVVGQKDAFMLQK